MHSWGAVFLMNVFIAATLGFADFVHEGRGDCANSILYFCNSVRGTLGHQIICLHAQVTSIS